MGAAGGALEGTGTAGQRLGGGGDLGALRSSSGWLEGAGASW